MTDRYETCRDCRSAIPLSSLKILNLYTIPHGFYRSPNYACFPKSDHVFSTLVSIQVLHMVLVFCSYRSQGNFCILMIPPSMLLRVRSCYKMSPRRQLVQYHLTIHWMAITTLRRAVWLFCSCILYYVYMYIYLCNL